MAENAVIDLHPLEIAPSIADELRLDDETLQQLSRYLETEITWADSARAELKNVWESNLRQYEAIPEMLRRDTPIVNASNIEIPLGAIAADAVYAQIMNTIFNIDPLVTVREVGETGRFTEHVKALQRFVDVQSRRVNLKPASQNATLDDVKMGTGILYIPWQEKRKKTLASEQVVSRGPMVRGVPVEDFFVPGGACDDFDLEPWVAMRYHLTEHDMMVRERDLDWNIDIAREWSTIDTVRRARERLGRNPNIGPGRAGGGAPDMRRTFEIFDVYVYYDIDGDGIDEDLYCVWDRGSRQVLKVEYNPYDRRPFAAMRYQLREYLFYGLGVVEMLTPFQRGASNLYNYWVDNALLANARFWIGRFGAVPNNQLHIWPNRFMAVQNPDTDLRAVPMADTYPSMPMALQQTMNFAERRSGLPEVSGARPGGMLGTRTPGITAMSILNKTSERFGPAFDAVREAITDAIRQVVMRYQERVLMGDEDAEQDILRMLGDASGQLILELFRDPNFANSVAVELTAATAQVNREADRQAWILLMQQVMQLGTSLFQLAQAIDSPEVGPVAKQVAQQLADVSRELLERVYRAFDQVRDPKALLIDLQEAMAVAQQQAQQQPNALEELAGMVDGLINQQQQGAQGAGGTPEGGAVSEMDALFGG